MLTELFPPLCLNEEKISNRRGYPYGEYLKS